MSKSFNEMLDRIAERKKTEAPGPDGTYTFTSKEAAIIVGGLNLVKGFASTNQRHVEASALIFWMNKEAFEIANRLAEQITNAQCPAYITEELDKFKAEEKAANQTDKGLS